MKIFRCLAAFASPALLSISSTSATAATVTVQVDKPAAPINPSMWGLFFEDINFGGDGGLYAQLIKNASFEFPEALMGWSVPTELRGSTQITIKSTKSNQGEVAHHLRIETPADGGVLENEGFRAIGLREGDTYDFSVMIRGAGQRGLQVELVTTDGSVVASARLPAWQENWSLQKVSLVATRTEEHARLRLRFEGAGVAEIDHVSLFPQKTWKNRPGGLRADMVQALADMHPGFLRFPGGCIVEGSHLGWRYQWKKTIGPVEERPLLIDRWNYEFKDRRAPDYYQSFGLGFYEFFLTCEDIGAQPLPILNCGMACQFNSGELVPLDELDPYIQDALDLIEFANGPASSFWGAKRAAMGHPEPFKLTMIGVGNEQWGPQYIERYKRFSDAIRAKYPDMKLVGAAGPAPADERFHYLWPEMTKLKADFVDEHCYDRPEWFFENTHRYDHYDRQGPKVFMGEYAAQTVKVTSPNNKNTWLTALSEAAFMTGLERNADVVRLASYAPLFGHVDAWQWTPNLIWVDNLRVLKTVNYYVQSLFAQNRGDRILPIALSDLGQQETDKVFASSTLDEKSGQVILKLVNATSGPVNATANLQGLGQAKPGTIIVMQSDDTSAMNTFEKPATVAPVEQPFTPAGSRFDLTLPANSFTVVRVGVR